MDEFASRLDSMQRLLRHRLEGKFGTLHPGKWFGLPDSGLRLDFTTVRGAPLASFHFTPEDLTRLKNEAEWSGVFEEKWRAWTSAQATSGAPVRKRKSLPDSARLRRDERRLRRQ
jgi:hypothetical protein